MKGAKSLMEMSNMFFGTANMNVEAQT